MFSLDLRGHKIAVQSRAQYRFLDAGESKRFWCSSAVTCFFGLEFILLSMIHSSGEK